MDLMKRCGEPFAPLTPCEIEDGLGGRALVWDEGEPFEAALRPLRASLSPEAMKERLSEDRALYAAGGVRLRAGDALRRLRDGTTWRVVSPPEARRTPEGSALDLCEARIERWELV